VSHAMSQSRAGPASCWAVSIAPGAPHCSAAARREPLDAPASSISSHVSACCSRAAPAVLPNADRAGRKKSADGRNWALRASSALTCTHIRRTRPCSRRLVWQTAATAPNPRRTCRTHTGRSAPLGALSACCGRSPLASAFAAMSGTILGTSVAMQRQPRFAANAAGAAGPAPTSRSVLPCSWPSGSVATHTLAQVCARDGCAQLCRGVALRWTRLRAAMHTCCLRADELCASKRRMCIGMQWHSQQTCSVQS
jgi:hypothetical protein